MRRPPGRGAGGKRRTTTPSGRFDQQISSVTVTQSVQSDLGITVATGVSQWNDQSGNGKHYTQGNPAAQPAYGSVTLNGIPALTFVNSVMGSSLITPLPGTTPTYCCFVARQNVWQSGARLLGDAQTGSNFPRYLGGFTSTPNIGAFNGTLGPLGSMTLGSWFFVEAYWSNSTSDFIKVGSGAALSGTNTGNSYTSLGRQIGNGTATGSFPFQCDLMMLLHAAGLPNGTERANLRSLVTSMYGGSVSV